MKSFLGAACVAAIALVSSGTAEANGCIKGAIVGGAAGHMAGHSKLGAAAGCAIGHHEANKTDANKNGTQPSSDQK
jgi:hypothetical protein